MKNILISALLCLGLMACGKNSVDHPVNVVPIVTPPAPAPVTPAPVTPPPTVVKGDKWQITFPNGWEKADVEQDESMLVTYGNKSVGTLAILERYSFDADMDTFVQVAAQSISESGARLISARPIVINDQKQYLLTLIMGDGTIWSWLTISGGYGYVLTCGGASPISQETCSRVANSFKTN